MSNNISEERDIEIIGQAINEELKKLPFDHPLIKLCKEYNDAFIKQIKEVKITINAIENNVDIIKVLTLNKNE